MALQPCRMSLLRSRQGARMILPCARSYTTTTAAETPESFKISESRESKTSAPRWSQTPAGMKAPLQMDFAKNPKNKVWAVNNDPARLDQMYERLLGQGGSKMLPDELKWLAVTHKSFDQGRRGFNDRLAMVGRMALDVEAVKDIVSKPADPRAQQKDEFDRQPFEHPKLAPVDNLSLVDARDTVGKEKLAALARSVGLDSTVRWKPRLVSELESSGVEVVLTGAVMAIVGAITLQHGTAVANRIIRERIMARIPKK
ncbi:RNase III domain-containing protein [Beauveria bassiana ARSEF 2860]|uniref:RNase III domain-containing protein n=1 Tax=Beauveria bassiana (strain ARSEF 2860) TaxID=655819 RepID=J4UG09_BEAB2|nr:RNase III domain-containing protein [Beauveria bassiana ARSEF 2860]EJP61637.1 RNase III domain-containing protein [Beauveria bassiana ARSEF 2860]